MKRKIALLVVFALLLSLVFTVVGCKPATVSVTGVTISGEPSITMTVDDTKTLTATVAPADATDATVTWSSSNTTVATVNSSGLVTAKAAGTAIITVKTTDGEKTASVTVNVSAKPVTDVAVTGVTLNNTTASIVVGATQTLTATVEPASATNKAVTWSTSNSAVATVNNGVVTAVTVGTANITVTSNNGKTATCAVTVTANPATVTGITLDQSKIGLLPEVDFNTATLVANVTPSTATGTVVWTTSDAAVATVNGGVVTAKAPGRVTITATVGTFKAECDVLVGNYTGSYTGTARQTTMGHIEVIVLTHNVLGVERILDIMITEANSYVTPGTLVSETTPTTTGTYATNWNNNVEAYINALIDLSVNELRAIVSTDGAKPANDFAFQMPTTAASAGQSYSILINAVKDALKSTTAKFVNLDMNTLEIAVPTTGLTTPAVTRQLTATVGIGSNKNLTWVSDNPAVVTVDKNGKVTAVGTGVANVYAFTDNGRYAKCVVTVINQVASIVIAPANMPLTVGGTDGVITSVTATYAGQAGITNPAALEKYEWVSSDDTIAKLKDKADKTKMLPTITAVKAGTVTFTCTMTTGTVSKTATMTVTVTASTAEVFKVTPNHKSLEFQKERIEEVQLTGEVTYINPTGGHPAFVAPMYWKYTYTVSNDVVSVDEKGIVTANPDKSGTATITMTATLWTGAAGTADAAHSSNTSTSATITVVVYETIQGVALNDKVYTDKDRKAVTELEFSMNDILDSTKNSANLFSEAIFHEAVSSFKKSFALVDFTWVIEDKNVIEFSVAAEDSEDDDSLTLEQAAVAGQIGNTVNVKIVGPGTTTITLTAITGEYEYLVSIPVTVYGIELAQGTEIGLLRNIGSQELQLDLITTLEGTPGYVASVWASGNKNVVTISETGLVKIATGKDAVDGKSTITVTVYASYQGSLDTYTYNIDINVLTVTFTSNYMLEEEVAPQAAVAESEPGKGDGKPAVAAIPAVYAAFDEEGYMLVELFAAADSSDPGFDFEEAEGLQLTLASITGLTYKFKTLVINSNIASATTAANVITIAGLAEGRAIVEITYEIEYFGVEYDPVTVWVVVVVAGA